jgi:subtilisin family serine protease
MLFIVLSGCAKHYNGWHLNEMRADNLWEHASGESQIIAIIDTGIDNEYAKQLGNTIIVRKNIIDNNGDVLDVNGHGTEITSAICGNGYSDVYGIAPKAKNIIIKAVNDDGKTDNKNLLKALQYAFENHATIVNISLGGFKTDKDVAAKLKEMISGGITIVAAAGDYGNKDLLFPANQEGVISVEAKGKDEAIWSNSNTSENSTLRFPGVDIPTISIYNGTARMEEFSGTSEACALASGYIALIKDYYDKKNVNLSNNDLIGLLEKLNSKGNEKVDYVLPFKN